MALFTFTEIHDKIERIMALEGSVQGHNVRMPRQGLHDLLFFQDPERLNRFNRLVNRLR